jgi:hypothetical protein
LGSVYAIRTDSGRLRERNDAGLQLRSGTVRVRVRYLDCDIELRRRVRNGVTNCRCDLQVSAGYAALRLLIDNGVLDGEAIAIVIVSFDGAAGLGDAYGKG